MGNGAVRMMGMGQMESRGLLHLCLEVQNTGIKSRAGFDCRPKGTRLRHPQEQAFFRAFRELHPDIPLVCVCGNHDVGNNPTQESIQTYKSKFGDDYFTFYCGGVMFIVINSQFYKAPEQVQDLAAEHDRWLDEQLEEAKSGKYKHVVVFQHIPWFIRNPDEEDLYFNINTEIREKMLKKFYEASKYAINSLVKAMTNGNGRKSNRIKKCKQIRNRQVRKTQVGAATRVASKFAHCAQLSDESGLENQLFSASKGAKATFYPALV
ncbi:Serine/threonine-protein phosphatase CPPED1 [Araneus ventricosus]|uniref:Serine/threonine-protein phosphatase CPPED1 n=1 Tax=Araneus ventricosus TaxID=182803 RepID=A0A4Y2U1J8_ARAVE|nr:Serine/threonine-protein phosphatase CPPED1 [Araneus ventricosus]